MLHTFLADNEEALVARCQQKVARRRAPEATAEELEHGIPLFLEQLIETLRLEQTTDPMRSREISGPASGRPAVSEIGGAAALHGKELLSRGYTIEQVVHDYGDLCQAITDLAVEVKAPVDIDEFRTLNRCLDNAIADAVSGFSYQRDVVIADKGAQALNVTLGVLSHELRTHLNSATLALHAIKTGDVGLKGATGAILESSLAEMARLIDRTLGEVRISAGLHTLHELFSLGNFIAEVRLPALLQAKAKGCRLHVSAVDPDLAVDADRDLLFSATGNLLQNAFKFTHPGTEVRLNAYGAADRICIDIKDECGGLPAGDAERMFEPFVQGNENNGGVGLGLSIAKRGVEAMGGILRVRDLPGSGCVFTIDLPRHSILPHTKAPRG